MEELATMTELQNAKRVPHDVVFLFDCDNTLLDNDHVLADLHAHMVREFGADNSARYWAIFEELRGELGYADYLGALQRYRQEHQNDTRLLLMSSFLIDYPFANRLYPGALDAIRHVSARGPTVILSDGDVVFHIHKETMLDQVIECYPARHYVMVDDKLRILTAMKKIWGERLTTVFPRQGHYALDPKEIAANPPADITIERIGELADFDLDALLGNGALGGA
jgi:hypothetical protein